MVKGVIMNLYSDNYYYEIKRRGKIKKILGAIRRWLTFFKFYRNRKRLIKKGSVIGKNTCIGKRTIVVNPSGLKIGKSTVITDGNLDARGRLVIGNNCIINDGVRILTATHDYNSKDYELIRKQVVISDYVWLATDCKVLPGVEIGYGAIVGSGTIVSKNIPDMAICVGNPAKIIGHRINIHDGFPTEKLVGADLEEYIKVIKKGE